MLRQGDCMSIYLTEEEQLEAIKKWWRKYSSIVTGILGIIFIIVVGYKYWSWHQFKINKAASIAYERMMLAFSNKDNKSIRAYAKELMHNYPRTVYADAAHLSLAKLNVSLEKYAEARKELEYVASSSRLAPLKQIAKIRIARLFAAEKSYDKALFLLNEITDSSYLPVINELKGDIYTATGKYHQAIKEYKKAITQVRINGMGNPFLEMKTNELAAYA